MKRYDLESRFGGAELKPAAHGDWVSFTDYEALRAERDALKGRCENQAERIQYLEGATNHATGTPLTKALERAEKAEARVSELEDEIAANKTAVDCANDTLSKRAQLIADKMSAEAENARLREAGESALCFIEFYEFSPTKAFHYFNIGEIKKRLRAALEIHSHPHESGKP